MRALARSILAHWDEATVGRPVPHTLDCLLRASRFRASRNVIFLVFADGSPEPVLLAKTPRVQDDLAALEREVANLEKLSSLRPAGLGSVPRVVSYRDWQDSKLLLETFVPGRPLSPALVRKSQPCVDSVMRWVTELHFASRAFVTGPSGSVRKNLENSLGRLAALFPASVELRQMLDRTHEFAEPLATHVLPRVFEHGELGARNILVDSDGQVGVVGWELADATGLPATDVFFFLTDVAFARADATTTGKYVETLESAFIGSPAWARPYVLDYAKAVGLSPRSLRPLFLLTWVRTVANLATRMQREGNPDQRGSQTQLQWLMANPYFGLWRFALEHWKELDL
ncbi:MAG TPA: aminoglycoside phosphotransferase family protein [Candidatus Krumholzibacteria bacterium]|nr:aminoglycoside phosphotransferase family protein [Candidatus Krumholzibacteria bacterium]